LPFRRDHLNLKLGLYGDDPVGPCAEGLDPGHCNQYGLNFRFSQPLLLVEGAYSYGTKDQCPSGTIKLGGWYDSGTFDDQRYPLGQNTSNNTLSIRHQGNEGVYLIIDQTIYRLPGPCNAKGVSVFGRAIVSPSDRNQVDAYADTGIVFAGMVPGRPNDGIALGFAYTGISNDASAFDRASRLAVIRNFETIFELNYAAEIVPGWIVQPVMQYIHNPGGSVPDEANGRPNQRIEDAFVLGVRTVVNY